MSRETLVQLVFILFLFALGCSQQMNVLPFIPLNSTNGVNLQTVRHTHSGAIPTNGFSFGDRLHYEVHIGVSGYFSFSSPLYSSFPQTFPGNTTNVSSAYIVAPFWDFIDLRRRGNIFYEIHTPETSQELLSQVSTFVSNGSFSGTWMLLTQWDQVHTWPDGESQRFRDLLTRLCEIDFTLTNTFQGLLITDGKESFTVFTYRCGHMEWTFYGATIGYNAAGSYFENHPNASSMSVHEIACLNGNGSEWSNVVYKLTVDCGSLPAPVNGTININRTTFDSRVGYSCDTGYELVGDVVRSCLANGNWSGSQPFCNIIDCGPMEPPHHGQIQFTTTTFLSLAVYDCDPGYTNMSDLVRECEGSGQWSGVEPACIDVNECETIFPCNSSAICLNTIGGFNCSCLEGFEGDGQDCEDVNECELNLSNCSQGCFNLYGSYQCVCQPGYRLGSDNTSCFNINECAEGNHTCHDNAECTDTVGGFVCACNEGFNGNGFNCTAVDCGSLSAPVNGTIDIGRTTFNSSVGYNCDTGYELVGDAVRSCLANGNWSGSQPFCYIVDCGPMEPPRHGQIQFTTTTFLSLAVYDCDPGYTNTSDLVRECEGSGQWSGVEPTCIDLNECETIFPCNGSAICLNTIGGFNCSCLEGFEGDRQDCDDVNECELNLSNCSQGCFNLYGSYQCVCQPGYRLGSDNTSCFNINECAEGNHTCHDNAVCLDTIGGFVCACNEGFNGNGFNCTAVDCGSLPALVNGTIDINMTSFDSSARYDCDTGYELIGDESRSCLVNGNWSGNQPTCIIVDCGPLEPPPQGEVRVNTTTFLSLATYDCIPGYTNTSQRVRVCEENGQWSNEEPSCTDVNECEFNLNNCSQECNNLLGSYQCVCQPGYQLGSDNTSCFNINECDQRTHSCNTNAECTDTIGGFNCSCNEGFNGDGFNCTVVDCGPLEPPFQGEVQFTTTTFLSLAIYTCNPGYTLLNMSQNIRVCEENGQWSNVEPYCRDINECVTLSPCNSNTICFNTLGGFNCSCLEGFEGDGNVCQDIDECKLNMANCSQECNNLPGSFQCICDPGFQLSDDNATCTNINECDRRTHNCHANAECTDTMGSFTCSCSEGYSGDGFNCIDLGIINGVVICLAENDPVWWLPHPDTLAGATHTQACPQNGTSTVMGIVTHQCLVTGDWDDVDTSGCTRQDYTDIRKTASELFSANVTDIDQ